MVVTIPQRLDERYYTRAEVDALIANINGFIASLVFSIGAQNTRLTAVEAAMPAFKFAGGTAQPLLQLQVKPGDFPGTAYYPTDGILEIATSYPPDDDPF